MTATAEPARPFAAPWQGPKPRRRSILGHILARLRPASLKVYSIVRPLTAYALPVGGLTCFTASAFHWAAVAGWAVLGVSMFVLDWLRGIPQ